MKSAAILLAAATVASGCHFVMGHSVQGSGKSMTKTVAMSGFKRIEADGAFSVEITQGPKPELKVIGDDNLVNLVKFEKNGDTLVAHVDGNYSTKLGLKLIATMPTVEGVTLNGSGDATLSGVQGEKLELEINGSGDVKAQGKVNSLKAEINGSGDIDASAVQSDSAAASISGSGNILVAATKTLNAAVSGSGSIRYKGKPQLSKAIDGSGEVEPM